MKPFKHTKLVLIVFAIPIFTQGGIFSSQLLAQNDSTQSKVDASRAELKKRQAVYSTQGGIFSSQLLAQNNFTQSKDDVSRAELNKKLADYLTGTRWEGHFTMTGEETPPKKEHYEIIKAEKSAAGDFWNLVVRIKYGDNDVTQPLPPIEIKWAGRTPMISVDKVTVPTLGTFDARVVIRKGADGQPGKYAGTWSHGKVGGHLFGMIYKIADEKKKADGENK